MPDTFNILDRAVAVPAWPVLPIRQVTNNRFFPNMAGASTTSAALGNGTLRLAPFVLPSDLTISYIGLEITSIGDVGSTVRLGIYETNAAGDYPGALLIEAAAAIDGTSVTVQEVACATTLRGGRIYWMGGAVQGVTVTQPTVRVTNSAYWQGLFSAAVPGAASTFVGYSQTGVTGALPATFTATVTSAGSAPRIHMRLA